MTNTRSQVLPGSQACHVQEFSSQKTEAKIVKNAISLTYDGGDIQAFLNRAEKAYNQAKFNKHAKFGLLREAMKADQFVLFRGAKDYEGVREYCIDYSDNEKMMSVSSGSHGHQPGNRRLPVRA